MPALTEHEIRLQLQRALDDPQWPQHAEVSKDLLRGLAGLLHQLQGQALAAPSQPSSVTMTDDWDSHFPPQAELTDVQREARNKVCIDGHLNAALDSVMRSNSPDEKFNILGVLANTAIDIVLSLQSSPKGASTEKNPYVGSSFDDFMASQPSAASGRELPPLPANVGWYWRMHCWAVTAHSKWRDIRNSVDTVPPTLNDQRSPDFISMEKVYTESALREYALAALTGAAPADADANNKAIYWYSVLVKCARLLNLPDDEPIPSGVLSAVERLTSAPTAPEPSAPADKVDAERFRAAIALNDNAETLYVAVINNTPDADAIRKEFDAAIDRMRSESGKGGKL